jgi:hypothetical protein
VTLKFQNSKVFFQKNCLRRYQQFCCHRIECMKQKECFSKISIVFRCSFLEHIFKKMGSTEIVMPSVRPSVRPSVSYFSAAIAPRELKF